MFFFSIDLTNSFVRLVIVAGGAALNGPVMGMSSAFLIGTNIVS